MYQLTRSLSSSTPSSEEDDEMIMSKGRASPMIGMKTGNDQQRNWTMISIGRHDTTSRMQGIHAPGNFNLDPSWVSPLEMPNLGFSKLCQNWQNLGKFGSVRSEMGNG